MKKAKRTNNIYKAICQATKYDFTYKEQGNTKPHKI